MNMILVKDIFGLFWAIGWAIYAIHLIINNKIKAGTFTAILAFALIGGITIARIDDLKKLFTGGMGAEYKDEMNTYKNTLIEEIKAEADTQKDSIKLLTKTAVQVSDILRNTMEQISYHEESINNLIESANKAEEKLQLAIEMVKPPALEFTTQRTIQVNDGYESIIGFMPTEDQALGTIKLSIEVIDNPEANINRFFPLGMVGGPISKTTEDGKKAFLQYSPPDQGLQQVIVQVSDTCNLLFTGNYISEPISITIPGEK
jgi:PAS domain-containing protein